jgi:hypothetical protein
MYRADMAREASWPQPASWMSLNLPAEKFLEIRSAGRSLRKGHDARSCRAFPFSLSIALWTQGWKSLPSPTAIAGRNIGKRDCSGPIGMRG